MKGNYKYDRKPKEKEKFCLKDARFSYENEKKKVLNVERSVEGTVEREKKVESREGRS